MRMSSLARCAAQLPWPADALSSAAAAHNRHRVSLGLHSTPLTTGGVRPCKRHDYGTFAASDEQRYAPTTLPDPALAVSYPVLVLVCPPRSASRAGACFQPRCSCGMPTPLCSRLCSRLCPTPVRVMLSCPAVPAVLVPVPYPGARPAVLLMCPAVPQLTHHCCAVHWSFAVHSHIHCTWNYFELG